MSSSSIVQDSVGAQFEWDPRPGTHNPRAEWHDRSQPPVSFSASAPQSAFASTSSVPSQRRRSSAAHTRPAAPPPNLPIPSVPGASPTSLQPNTSSPDPLAQFPGTSTSHLNGRATRSSSFAHPPPSYQLNTVSAPTHAPRASSSTQHQDLSSQSSMEDLSDPPPQSFLRPPSSRSNNHQQELSADAFLLSPPGTQSQHRPSSRRALTRALELAREAVQLDSTNDNPQAAVNAYAQSVALLSEVMERVRRGEESTETGRRRRRRSVAAQEEEVRRLQNIHDTYADRMNILSIIYSIPTVPYSTSSMYSSMTISTDSNTSNSPTNSASPSSDASPQIPQHQYTNYIPENQQPSDTYVDHNRQHDGLQGIGAAITLGESLLAGSALSGLPSTSMHHPYATPHDAASAPPQPVNGTPPRTSILRRPRTSSAYLPPPPPPPMNALPPAPLPAEPTPEYSPSLAPVQLDIPQTRQRDVALGHRRTGSGLAALEEEREDARLDGLPSPARDRVGSRNVVSEPPRPLTKRDSHPLPPLPSPTDSSSGTPRTTVSRPPPSPRLMNTIAAPRPRGTSQLTTRAELANQPQIINTTTTQGTISQRRSKPSPSPSSRPSSPASSTASAGSIPPKSATQSLPSVPVAGSAGAGGRSRSSSQPGRRPSLVSGRISPLDQARPPLPSTVGANGTMTGARKASFPSKVNPGPSPLTISQISVNTDVLSPPGIFPGNLPTTPVSPLPPAPPIDPLLKPYHMMHLLSITMTSSTGGYVTRRLHVPCEVWSQGGAKLTNLVEKVRVVGILCSALEELQSCSADYFGAGNVSSGMALGIGSIGRKEADAWLAKLEDFSNVCDGVVANFGKKLSVGEGFVLKKTTWGDKLTRRFDKLTNGKNLDSPAAYVQGLKKLFLHAQLLDEHTRAVQSQPIAPAYAAFPPDIRLSVEQKLKRSSEFFASVVLTFVIRDLSQLLDKYAKKCEKWLAE